MYAILSRHSCKIPPDCASSNAADRGSAFAAMAPLLCRKRSVAAQPLLRRRRRSRTKSCSKRKRRASSNTHQPPCLVGTRAPGLLVPHPWSFPLCQAHVTFMRTPQRDKAQWQRSGRVIAVGPKRLVRGKSNVGRAGRGNLERPSGCRRCFGARIPPPGSRHVTSECCLSRA
jgi:hypothetical protein